MTWTKDIPANPVVAVAGATGAVGNEFLEVLRVRSFLLRAAARFLRVNSLFGR